MLTRRSRFDAFGWLGNHLIKVSFVLVVLVLRDEFLLQQFVEILLSAIAERLRARTVSMLANKLAERSILDQDQ